MTDLVFVDTNVLVYRRDTSEPTKQPRAKAWIDGLWTHRLGRVSSQVLQEYYQTVTRKLKPGLTREEAREEVRDLGAWRPVMPSPELLERAFHCEDRFALSFWDAMIAAAAHQAACRYLLSEDMQDGLDIEGVVVVSPFAHDPGDLNLW
ncbi:MAG: PIN domain-containing protein [Polyangiaceae bacterium]|nr:PIN domain-containing protein [Polyangiaceae bacterium]